MALSTQVRASTGSAVPWRYDVFLSFRGEDTRKSFTDHLYHKLQWRGIKTFRDDPGLERGTTISLTLLEAIEQSRFAVVVLSPNYANSKWCLLELCKILEHMKEKGSILPVFYEVEPSDVRHQRGSFAEAFSQHVDKYGEDSKEVEGWRDALSKVASLAGWATKDYRYETELMKKIVQVLWSKVHPTINLSDSTYKLVGIDAKLKEMDVLLDREADDVRFIGIWGMGGVGKTTLARVVYEKISDQFEVCIFLADVRELSTTLGLVRLQRQILSQILNEENVRVWNVYDGMTTIKRCVCNKAILLVLDDVDEPELLKKLVGEKDWFGLGSRIIITTRNRHLLVTHGVEEPYELKGLDFYEALQLFCLHAFKMYEPEEGYSGLSDCFVNYAKGLPLALKTLGSFLYRRSPETWGFELENLQNSTPTGTVFDVLKSSYDGLHDMQKKIFLDIACFSSECKVKFVTELLYSFDMHTRIAIDVLIEKSLLTISSDDEISMHDLIKEMGCKIVRQESYEEPGRRSRLWLSEDIYHVFTNNTGTEAIEGIFLHLPKLEEAPDWNLDAFSIMFKLKLLYIHNLRLSLGPNCLPDGLRFLIWSWYPSKSLPPGFQPNELTELSLSHSNIHHLWNGTKYLPKLKSIDLSYSIKLTRTPDFKGIQNLEKLVLEGCTNLVHIHPSIAFLKRLKVLNFRNCKSIKILPSEVEMKSLETFDVSGCSKLQVIPQFLGQMNRLSKFNLSGTAVEKLPSSFEHFGGSLVELDLCGIVMRELPFFLFLKQNLRLPSFGFFSRKSPHPLIPLLSSLKHLTSLTTLMLNDCHLSEGDIPDDIGSLASLQSLELKGNNFVTLPESIRLLSKLISINVENCQMLQRLPDLPSSGELDVTTDNCTCLQVFPDLPGFCRLSEFMLSSINCLSTVGDHDSCYFIYSVLKRLLEETPCSFNEFCFVIPGGEIVEWFNNQSVGDSVTMKLPSYASNSSKWIGVAVCALLVPQVNPSAVPENDSLDPDKSLILCKWNGSYSSTGFGSVLTQILSDHIFLVVLPSRVWRPKNSLEDDAWDDVKFVFETTQAVGNKRCVKVKKCGVRALYEHDMEDLISRINQSNNSVFLYEAMDEQKGADQEETTSRSGDSHDEYYSAEE